MTRERCSAVEPIRQSGDFARIPGSASTSQPEPCPMAPYVPQETVAAVREDGGCTCPSGDGSLRWPCPKHPPTVVRVHHHDAPEQQDYEVRDRALAQWRLAQEFSPGPTDSFLAGWHAALASRRPTPADR